MKIKNLRVVPKDNNDIGRIKSEYEAAGFDVELRGNELLVHAIPRKLKNKNEKPRRDKETKEEPKKPKPKRSEQRPKSAKE